MSVTDIVILCVVAFLVGIFIKKAFFTKGGCCSSCEGCKNKCDCTKNK